MRQLNNLLAITFCVVYSITSAQTAPDIQWQNGIGGSNDEILSSCIQTTDNGYFIGGSSRSPISGDKTEPCQGFDYWVLKLNESGDILWQNTIGGEKDDFLSCVIQTIDNGFLLGGYTSSDISGDKTENSLGSDDFWIVKLNPNGNIDWQNTIGGNGTEELTSLIQTADGGFLVAGWSTSGISGDKNEISKGFFDYWIVKLDEVGNIQWQKTIGGSSEDYLNSVIQTTDGGYLLGGESFSGISGDKTEVSQGLTDYWVVKLSGSGEIQWQNTIGGSDYDKLTTVIQCVDGGYLLGGSSISGISGDKTEANTSGSNCLYCYTHCWIIRLDNTGNIEWQNTIGGNSDDNLTSVIETTDGGYLVGGWSFSGLSVDKSEESQGYSDYWVIKLDGLGNVEWQNNIGGKQVDDLHSMTRTNDGGYLLGGSSASGQTGDKTDKNHGLATFDYWLVKFYPDPLLSTPCPMPQSVYLSNVTYNTAVINWTGNSSAFNYRVRKRPVGTTNWIYSSVLAPDTSKKIVNNLPATPYEVQAQTFCDSLKTDSSGYTASVYFFSPCNSCPLPTSVFISNITTNSADVNWTGSSCAVSYRVRKRPVTSLNWIYSAVFAPASMKTIVNNQPGTDYEVQVETFCDSAKTDSSGYTVSTYFTSLSTCVPVNGASTADITATSANLNWTYSFTPPNWIINYRVANTSTWSSITITGAQSSYLLSNIFSSTKYNWKIRAKCGNTKSSWSPIQTFKTKALKLSDQNEVTDDLMIYPNPNNGHFLISMKKNSGDKVTIEIQDVFGQIIQYILVNSGNADLEEQISIDDISEGIYFIKVTCGSETIVRKAVIKRN